MITNNENLQELIIENEDSEDAIDIRDSRIKMKWVKENPDKMLRGEEFFTALEKALGL